MMKKKILALVLALTMALSLLPVTAMAATITGTKNDVVVTPFSDLGDTAADVAENLAKAFVDDPSTIVEGSAKLKYSYSSQVASVTGGTALFGFDGGFMLSTGDAANNLTGYSASDSSGESYKDEDLAALIAAEGRSYGGDTAMLEFQLTATGTDLTFNYIFGSCEFDQGASFNDIFGLFIKVNNGNFENIALLPNGKNVTITNLRTDLVENPYGNPIGSDTPLEYVKPDISKTKSAFNGWSIPLTAAKKVAVGDTVTIKFVIADVGDTGFDSAIIMQSGSLKFSGSANELTNITDGVSLALNQAATGAEDFAVTVDDAALDDGLYNVVGATSTSPTIKFADNVGLTCASKISVSIEGIDNPIEIINKLPHNCSYTANSAVITETCSNGCGHSATAMIAAPDANTLVYDGTTKAATVTYSDNWQGGTLSVTYDNHGNVDVGTVKASITKADATAMISYEITDGTTPTPTPTPTYPSYVPTPVEPPVNVDIHDDTLSDAAKAVGSAVKSGKADINPVAGYTMDSIAQLQKDNALKLVVEKKDSYDPAEKRLIDTAAQEKGETALVQFLEIDVTLRTMNDVIVAEVDDTVVPLTITVDLNDEMQKAAKEGKTIYVARAHDGKVTFIEGTLNAEKTQFTFDSSKFSTYALVAFDGATVTSAKTADAGIFMAVSMTILSVAGSAVLLKKKED